MTTTVTFANTGGASGSSCVDVKLFVRNNLENSQIVCSGQVEPGTSKVETARFGLAVLGDKQYSVKCDRLP
ncbi:hypothetical protein AUJ14_04495 [Candidatus Micrarchaeota archaeon CG1_02_55_22]|nr:MAG: hypothetical protein AUJ14_04495 [Candidatus Micrarchaeota archaeon CG1_02_55_22]